MYCAFESRPGAHLIVDQNSDFNAQAETYDGVHPNEQGEKKMAARWFDALGPLLDNAADCQP